MIMLIKFKNLIKHIKDFLVSIELKNLRRLDERSCNNWSWSYQIWLTQR